MLAPPADVDLLDDRSRIRERGCRGSRTAASTSGAIAQQPRSTSSASRRPLTARRAAAREVERRHRRHDVPLVGSLGDARNSRASSTVRASGPKWWMVSNWVGRKSSGIRPKLGFSPTTPDHAAGMRTDPPMSLPSASGTQPDATAAPEPPDEPPGVRSVSHGFRVTPHSGLSVKLE